MSYQSINRGTVPNDNTGDTLRNGAEKINLNFQEIYNSLGDGSNITFNVASYTSETQTLTNKTIDSANNTLILGFNDLYDVNIPIVPTNGQLLKYDTGAAGWVASIQDVKGVVKSALIPDTDSVYDLGSSGNKFKDLYLNGNTISLGSTTITSNSGVLEFSSPIKIGNNTGNVPVEADLVPVSDSIYNLGSPTNKFHSLYLANSTIYLGTSALSVTPNGLEFIEEPKRVVNVEEKNVFTFNPNIDVVQTYFDGANTVADDQLHFYTFNGLSDANSVANFFDVGTYANSGFGFINAFNNFVLDSPVPFTAKLNIYTFTNYKTPILSYDWLPEVDLSNNINYTIDGNGYHTLYPASTPNTGFVFGPQGEVIIVSPWSPVEFELYFNNIDFTGANGAFPTGIFAKVEIYQADPVKSLPKPIKSLDKPVGISAIAAPSSNTANGTAGDLVINSGYLYVCHTDNMWVRLPVETSW